MDALILMTRIPIPGKTKTRLMKILSAEECAEIHRCFLLDIFDTFQNIKNDMDINVTYTPGDTHGIIAEIVPEFVSSFPQSGDTLGLRMLNSIGKILDEGYKKVVLIGSDIPDIKSQDIREAFSLLDSNDVVLGPTYDGGYYLIGMKEMHRELFDDSIKWGGKSVFEGTVDTANKSGLKVGLAAKHMDIDDEKDLLSFMDKYNIMKYQDDSFPLNTVAFINELRSDLNNVGKNVGK